MRSREQVIWDFVGQWLKKAETDLRAAAHLLKLDQPDHFTAAFHAQQAAEKFLKAFLVRHQVLFPKTHDIAQLLKLAANIDPAVGRLLASATALTPYGVDFRYPGDQVSRRNAKAQSFGPSSASLRAFGPAQGWLGVRHWIRLRCIPSDCSGNCRLIGAGESGRMRA